MNFLYMQDRIYDSRVFEIKYYNNIRANFPLYFNLNADTITIIDYLNNWD